MFGDLFRFHYVQHGCRWYLWSFGGTSEVTEFDARSAPERLWVLAGGVLANVAVVPRHRRKLEDLECYNVTIIKKTIYK